MNNRSSKSKILAIILCLVGFIGIGGLHRFYVGKSKTGLAYLLTFGIFGFGTLVDLILLVTDKFKDVNGLFLRVDNQSVYSSQPYKQTEVQQIPQQYQSFNYNQMSNQQNMKKYQSFYNQSPTETQQSTQEMYGNPMTEVIKTLIKKNDNIIATEEFNKNVKKDVGEHATETEFKVVGVTYEGRQLILEDIYNNEVESCRLEFDIYNNEPCIPVFLNDEHIGYIAKKEIDFFIQNLDKIRRVRANVYNVHDTYCVTLYINYYD